MWIRHLVPSRSRLRAEHFVVDVATPVAENLIVFVPVPFAPRISKVGRLFRLDSPPNQRVNWESTAVTARACIWSNRIWSVVFAGERECPLVAEAVEKVGCQAA